MGRSSIPVRWSWLSKHDADLARYGCRKQMIMEWLKPN
jgi:hypothetical protein